MKEEYELGFKEGWLDFVLAKSVAADVTHKEKIFFCKIKKRKIWGEAVLFILRSEIFHHRHKMK